MHTIVKSLLNWLRSGGIVLALLSTAANAQAPAAGEYRFSPVNQYGIQLTAAYWNPIINYVSDKSGVKLALRIGRTSADTTAYVLAQEVEFIFSNHLFSPERQKLGLSIRDLVRRQQREEMSRFMQDDSAEGYTLGDLLKEKDGPKKNS